MEAVKRQEVRERHREKLEALIKARQEARSARDFARADAIREGVMAAGVVVKDTPEGPIWEITSDFDPAKLEALQ